MTERVRDNRARASRDGNEFRDEAAAAGDECSGAALAGDVDSREIRHRRTPIVLVLRRSLFLAAITPAFAVSARAQDSLPRKLPPVVTVTRDVGRSPLDLPYAISSTRPDSLLPGQTHTLVEQTLSLLPGVTVGAEAVAAPEPGA